jgi:hypothetical protein
MTAQQRERVKAMIDEVLENAELEPESDKVVAIAS